MIVNNEERTIRRKEINDDIRQVNRRIKNHNLAIKFHQSIKKELEKELKILNYIKEEM